MNRRNVVVAAFVVVALLVAVVIYVGGLQAGDPAPSKKTPAAPTAAEEIKHLETRIASLEQRIAALEKRPTSVSLPPGVVPKFTFVAPSSDETWDANDGFPPARFLLIDAKTTNTQSGR
jgi:hypothetical protein